MKIPNRSCVICSNKYHYCNNGCADSLKKPIWMTSFCSENCKNIYYACSMFNAKKITTEEAKHLLDLCDLSSKEHFTLSTQKIINEIYETIKIEDVLVVEENEVVKEADVVEEIDVEEDLNSSFEEDYSNNAAKTILEVAETNFYKKKKKKNRRNN